MFESLNASITTGWCGSGGSGGGGNRHPQSVPLHSGMSFGRRGAHFQTYKPVGIPTVNY